MKNMVIGGLIATVVIIGGWFLWHGPMMGERFSGGMGRGHMGHDRMEPGHMGQGHMNGRKPRQPSDQGDAEAPRDDALATVKVPELSTVALEGKTLFEENCSTCHGTNASGRDGIGPPLVHIIYEPNHHSDAAFYLAAQRGVRAHHWPFGNMPAIEEVSEAEVTKIIAYVRELQRANGIN